MDVVGKTLKSWKNSLPINFDGAALYSKSPIAHKWKAPLRCLVLRETILWRMYDLMNQSYVLHSQNHALGARILLRSAIETLAILIYLNQLINKVLNQNLDFHEFSDKTSVLLLGSKNQSTKHTSINIMTVLKECDKIYPEILNLYADFSESAHPNFEGLCLGYSTLNIETSIATFSNNWRQLHSGGHLETMLIFMRVFESEYNQVFIENIRSLEKWIEQNDLILEANKN